MGMVQLGDRFRLARESLLALPPRGEILREDLDGYCAIETGVSSFVNFAHPARSDGREAQASTGS